MTIIRKTATILSLTALVVMVFVGKIQAISQYQQCSTNTTCQIGEFLYDDNYSPITSASCTINVKNPDSSSLLNNIAMTANSDGWYSYNVPVGSTLGIYRTQVCCNASGDYLCIDKTFEVAFSSDDVAEAVWDHDDRSLTSFGTLVSDFWNHSSDSLGSFATKITSVFNDTNTLTGDSSTDGDVLEGNASSIPDLSEQVASNRALIQQLLNTPIIQNFINEDDSVPLTQKLDEASTAVNGVFSDVQTIKAKLTSLMLKWPTLTNTRISTELDAILSLFGSTTDTSSNNTLMSNINYLLQNWDSPIINDVLSTTNNTITSTSLVQNILEDIGTGDPTFQDSIIDSLDLLSSLETVVGDASDSLGSTTLFGFLRKIQSSTTTFGSSEIEIQTLLKNYDQYSQNDLINQIEKIKQTVLANNQLKDAQSLLYDPINPDNPSPKHTLHALQAIISANKKDLTSPAGNPVSDLWIQEHDGYMLFRGFILNPSATNKTSQVKYSLPAELSNDNIVSFSDNITVEYDPGEETFMLNGNFPLSPQELVTFYAQTDNIWGLTTEDLDGYLKQAEDLTNSLRRTSLYAQASSLKTDIEVDLDKIRVKISGYKTPEEKIQAVREAQLDLLGVQEKINTLKELVSETSSAKSIVGAVGGIQTVAVWGLLLIFVAGFVFLVVFMRRMNPATVTSGIKRSVVARPLPFASPTNRITRARTPRMPIRNTDFKPNVAIKAPFGKLAFTGILTVALATVVVGLITRTSKRSTPTQSPNPPIEQSQGVVISNQDTPGESEETQAVVDDPTQEQEPVVLGSTSTAMMLDATDGIDILSSPSETSEIVMSLSQTQEVFVFSTKKDPLTDTSFSRIGFSESDNQKNWWVPSSLLSSIE